MELSSVLKQFIEENIDLLESDIYDFIDKLYIDRKYYWEEFRTKILPALDFPKDNTDKFVKLVKDLEAIVDKLVAKYELFEIKPQINGNGVTEKLEDILELFDYTVSVTTKIVNNEFPYKDYTLRAGAGLIEFKLIDKDGVASSLMIPRNTFISIKPIDLFRPQNLLKEFEQSFTDTCDRIVSCLTDAEQEISNLHILNNILPDIEEKMSLIAQDIVGEDKITTSRSGYSSIYTLHISSKSPYSKVELKIDFGNTFAYVDVNKLIEDWAERLEKEKKKLEKRATKQAEREANRPENYKKLTLKEIKEAIRNAGFTPSTTTYTNKNVNTTSYKFQFMDLDEDQRDRVRDELIKMGADLKSVETRTSYGGRGAYNSLIVTLNN